MGGVSALILAAVGGVILITFFTARASTLELLRDRADLGLELLETRIRGQLDPITDVGNGLVALITDATSTQRTWIKCEQLSKGR